MLNSFTWQISLLFIVIAYCFSVNSCRGINAITPVAEIRPSIGLAGVNNTKSIKFMISYFKGKITLTKLPE
jgi:hypothetical protein